MSLYKRRRSKERPVSMYTGSVSPVLLSFKTYAVSPPLSPQSDITPFAARSPNALTEISDTTTVTSEADSSGGVLDTTLTGQSENVEQYDLEIAELQHSPNFGRKRVWNFSTPDVSPSSSKKSGDLSDTPSPDLTPIASRDATLNDSIPPSPASTISSTLHQFASRLKGTHSSTALDTSCSGQRYMVISEIMDTERKYITNLEILLGVYLPALENIVAARDLRLLFPAQLEPMVERHSKFLVKLEDRMSDNTLFPGIVGDIFASLLKEDDADFLDMYSAYMNEFKVAMTTLARYEQSSTEFRDQLVLTQHSSSCEGLSLASYLLTPVQRLPRYELLLKELLRQTPLDHPDNFYVSDAIDLIHEELIRLNQSIRSCQLACSVRRVPLRRPSLKIRTERAIAKLKRHVSTANIDDYSSGDSSTGQEVSRVKTARRRRATLKSSIYRSEENLFVRGEEDEGPLRVKSMMNIRPANSEVDLTVSYDGDIARRKTRPLTPLASLPVTPDNSRPTSPSGSCTHTEDGPRNRSRLSVYSTASSTSGIGSIENSQFDLRLGSLTPTHIDPSSTSTPVSTRVSFRVESPASVDSDVLSSVSGASVPSKREGKGFMRMSWTKAFKSFGRKKNYSAGKVLDIGSPKDFRHIQHGFPSLPEGVESYTPPCTSNASSSNTLNAVHVS